MSRWRSARTAPTALVTLIAALVGAAAASDVDRATALAALTQAMPELARGASPEAALALAEAAIVLDGATRAQAVDALAQGRARADGDERTRALYAVLAARVDGVAAAPVPAETSVEPDRGEPSNAVDCERSIAAALAQYDVTGSSDALARAIAWQDELDQRWWRADQQDYDGTPPSAPLDLVRLARITGDHTLAERARAVIATRWPAGDASAPPLLLVAAIEDTAPILHLTLIAMHATDADDVATAALLAAAHRRLVPGLAVTVLDGGPAQRALLDRFGGMVAMPPVDGRPTAYLCTERACDPPTTDPEALARAIRAHAGR